MKLDAKNVSVSIAGKPIVRNLSIEVPDPEVSAAGCRVRQPEPLSAPSTAHKDGRRHRSSG